MKLSVVAFGCQMSVADSQEMARPLIEAGFAMTPDMEEADVLILNTCTVRQHAEDRAVSFIGRLRLWKERRPGRLLIVAGCAAERLGAWIPRRFPHVDLVSGARSIEDYPRMLREALRERFDWERENELWDPPPATHLPMAGGGARPPAAERPVPDRDMEMRGDPGPDSTAAPPVPSPVSAYVTIMRGCNYSCSYCIVPSVRGRELYRPLAVILEEARRRVAEGAREVMLLGQTVNSYRSGEGARFADLLAALDAVRGLERVRFMSPHPYYVDAPMIEAMAASRTCCRHIHLPLQSGSDRVLRSMRRSYTAGDYLSRLEALRRRLPGIDVTTDLIAGYPGESEEDFRRSLEVLREVDPCSAYCFKFSPRPGTEAALLPEAVPPEEAEARLQALLEAVAVLERRHLAAQAGRRVEVLLEDERRGRTFGYFHAELEAPGRPGATVRGTVAGASAHGLRVRPS